MRSLNADAWLDILGAPDDVDKYLERSQSFGHRNVITLLVVLSNDLA